tara:strand:+ start:5886 stop:6560 length:675 start_codon:yes stop_codon:yes gene_type:complete
MQLVKNSLTLKMKKMKNLIKYLAIIVVITNLSVSAQENNPMEKAIEKGKSDLLEILSKSQNEFNFGVNSEKLRGARGAEPVPFKQMDFQKLLEYNDGPIERLISPTEKFIIALVNQNQLVTTISIEEKQGNFQVSELINQQYTKEMSMLPAEVRQSNYKNVSIVHVPNLRATLYNVAGKTYTAYNGRSLREAQDMSIFMQELKRDAVIFQEKYGEMLKNGRLID